MIGGVVKLFQITGFRPRRGTPRSGFHVCRFTFHAYATK